MRPRLLHAAAVAVALLPAPPVARGEEPSSPRGDLEVMEAVLDNAVRRVSRPSGAPFLGGAEASRGYRLNGYGAVFVVPPRALPGRSNVLVIHDGGPGATIMQWSEGEPPAVATHDDIEGALAQLRDRQRRIEREIQQSQDGRKRTREARQRDLEAIEAKVEALQREAERKRQEAERALEAAVREVRFRLAPQAEPAPAPGAAPMEAAVPGAPQAPPIPPAPALAPRAPAPPWRFWFNSAEDDDDARTPERVVRDVRNAVARVLEFQGPRLKAVRPEEFVTVAVDFVRPWGFFDDEARAAKTLIVRVRKKELEDREASRISADELHSRIEYVEY